MNATNQLFGVGYRSEHYLYISQHDQKSKGIGGFEFITENFLGVGGRPYFFLESLRRDYPLLMHGVSLSVGGRDQLNYSYLKKVKQLISAIKPLKSE